MAVVYLTVDSPLTLGTAINILENADASQASKAPPKNPRSGEIYLYEVKPETKHMYWHFDGLQYKCSMKYPRDSQFRRAKYALLSNGKLVDFRRIELQTWSKDPTQHPKVGGDIKNWRIPFVLVEYQGSFNPNAVKKRPHGNTTPTPEKVKQQRGKHFTSQFSPATPPGHGQSPVRKVRITNPFSGIKKKLFPDLTTFTPSRDEKQDREKTPPRSINLDSKFDDELRSSLPGREPVPDPSPNAAKGDVTGDFPEDGEECFPDVEVILTEVEHEQPNTPVQGPVYIRTNPEVRERMMELQRSGQNVISSYRQTLLETSMTGANDAGSSPRNKEQAYNISRQLKSLLARDDIFEAYAFGKEHGNIVRFLALLPGVAMVLAHPETRDHVHGLMMTNSQLVWHYDTTFKVGPMYVSPFVIRHPLLVGEPITPVMFLLHEVGDKLNAHSYFFSRAKHLFPLLNSSNMVIVSDREQAIINAIRAELPQAKLFYCWNHMKRNVADWATQHLPPSEAAKCIADSRKLLQSATAAEYATTLTACRETWSQEFTTYFDVFQSTDFRNNALYQLREYQNLADDMSGLTNNASESFNHSFKTSVSNEAGKNFDSLIYAIHMLQSAHLVDIVRGLRTTGNYKPKKEVSAQMIQQVLDSVANEPDAIDVSLIPAVTVSGFLPRRRDPLTERRVMPKTQEGIAEFLIETNKIDFLPKRKCYVVTEMDKSYIVSLGKMSCSCPRQGQCAHLIAVLKGSDLYKGQKPKRATSFGNIGALYRKTIGTFTGKKGNPALSVPKTQKQYIIKSKGAGKKCQAKTSCSATSLPATAEVHVETVPTGQQSSHEKECRQAEANAKPSDCLSFSGEAEAKAPESIPSLSAKAAATASEIIPSSSAEADATASESIPSLSAVAEAKANERIVSLPVGKATDSEETTDFSKYEAFLAKLPKLTKENAHTVVVHRKEVEVELKVTLMDLTTLKTKLLRNEVLSMNESAAQSGMEPGYRYTSSNAACVSERVILQFAAEVLDVRRHVMLEVWEAMWMLNLMQAPGSEAANVPAVLKKNRVNEEYWANKTICILPLNISGVHWVLVAVLREVKEVQVLDSMGKFELSLESNQKIKKYLLPRWGMARGWIVTYPKKLEQQDAVNCGVYFCKYMLSILSEDYLLTGESQSLQSPFSTSGFRGYILSRIMDGCDFTEKVNEKICYVCLKVEPPGGSENKINWSDCGRCHRWYHNNCLKKANLLSFDAFTCKQLHPNK